MKESGNKPYSASPGFLIRLSTIPVVRPRRKYGKNGTTVKNSYGDYASCRSTLKVDTVQRTRFTVRLIISYS